MEYPDLNEEFEARYADELDLLNEFDDEDEEIDLCKPLSRRSLSFPSPKKCKTEAITPKNVLNGIGSELQEEKGKKRDANHMEDEINTSQTLNTDFPVSSKRRCLETFSEEITAHGSEKTREIDLNLSTKSTSKDNGAFNFNTTEAIQDDSFNEELTFVDDELNSSKDELQHVSVWQKIKSNCIIWKRIPPGESISVTSGKQNRVYLRVRSEDEIEREGCRFKSLHRSFQLLSVPYAVLREQAEEERFHKLIDESKQISDQLKEQASEESSDSGCDMNDEEFSEELWVEKYKPKRYLELLSDDFTNRTLLYWLKLWDKVVFGREPKLLTHKKEQSKTAMNQQKNKFKKLPEVTAELDSINRPLQKIALLCGPPGLGKTTLAHIIAKHAGYNVVEMNASDDRSPEVFQTQLEAATQMRAVMGAAPKPNCLIIDEIDGAPSQSINLLMEAVNSKNTANENKGKKKKKKTVGTLLRPIICICNDQYVPALRPLRQQALVLMFPPTASPRLASRLLEVARRERMLSDLTVLLALCEKTDNDIRSCLSTLQFIKSRRKEIRMLDVQSSNIGQKDQQKSLFSIWQEIFFIPRPKRKRFAAIVDKKHEKEQSSPAVKEASILNNTSTTARFFNILHLAQSCGEFDKLIQGLFENYLNMKFKDSKFESVAAGTDWLCFTDVINKEILHLQNYNLMPYLSFSCVVFHFLFSSTNFPKISYPSASYEFQMKFTKTSNLLASLLNDVAPSVKAYARPQVLILDILPYLQNIIQPTLRPVNTQLYTNREKEELSRLIDIMISYNLTYIQERNLEGQYNYILDPNVEEVSRFPGCSSQKVMTYAAKQLITREIELEKLRRSESKLAERDLLESQKPRVQESSSKPPVENKTDKATKPEKPHIPNHLQKLDPKAVKIEELVSVDFFGRIIKTVPTLSQVTAANNELSRNDIWFHFKEGYSNAVRRNVRVKDFF